MTSPQLDVFYDGQCPLCAREMNALRRLDRKRRIHFIDLTRADLATSAPGKTLPQLMEKIHARLPNGEWIDGVEVFRRLYGLVGFRWLILLTRIPGIAWLLDRAYLAFARNRLRLTGRCDDTCTVPGSSLPPTRS